MVVSYGRNIALNVFRYKLSLLARFHYIQRRETTFTAKAKLQWFQRVPNFNTFASGTSDKVVIFQEHFQETRKSYCFSYQNFILGEMVTFTPPAPVTSALSLFRVRLIESQLHKNQEQEGLMVLFLHEYEHKRHFSYLHLLYPYTENP